MTTTDNAPTALTATTDGTQAIIVPDLDFQ